MRIFVDAMGGDNAPQAPVEGAIEALRLYPDLEITLAGDLPQVEPCLKDCDDVRSRITLVDAPEVITNDESPVMGVRRKKNSATVIGMLQLKEKQVDGFVSCGSTGAVLAGGMFRLGRIPGIERPALAPVLPTGTQPGALLIDCGANVDCRPEYLLQFGMMGSIYMEKVMGVHSPRVALINNGSEECKGRDLEIETYAMLRDERENGINFTGNIEAREIPSGDAEVLVTDGFTGNIVLKLYEGLAKFFAGKMKDLFSGAGKIGGLFVADKLMALKDSFDYKKVGGAVLLGIAKPVIKAHGSSNGEAFFHAIRQAKNCVDGHVCETITDALAARKSREKSDSASEEA